VIAKFVYREKIAPVDGPITWLERKALGMAIGPNVTIAARTGRWAARRTKEHAG
jgi:hypothetical protein